MPSLKSLLPAALLLATASAAPVGPQQKPLESVIKGTIKDKYPFTKDPYDRKHDTYGDGVQPLPIVSWDDLSLYAQSLTVSQAQWQGHKCAWSSKPRQRSPEPRPCSSTNDRPWHPAESPMVSLKPQAQIHKTAH